MWTLKAPQPRQLASRAEPPLNGAPIIHACSNAPPIHVRDQLNTTLRSRRADASELRVSDHDPKLRMGISTGTA